MTGYRPTRREVLQTGMVLGFSLLLPSARGQTAQTGPQRRPNVLFIAIDDLRPELGCYGHPRVRSPHIDALAARSLRFDRAYCQQAVCGPSRTSLLTGLRPDTTGVINNRDDFRKALPDAITLPEHFKRNGYQVLAGGKIFHNDDARSWSQPIFRPSGEDWLQPDNAALVQRLRQEARDRGETDWARIWSASLGPPTDAADVPDNAYFDGQTCDFAIDALRQMGDRPFFLAVGFNKPHLPFIAPRRYWDLYDPADIQLADNPFSPKDMPTAALYNGRELRRYHGVPKEGPISDEQARHLIHGYYACVSYVDAQVGRLLDELSRLGLAEQTIVVVWGDHGWKLGEHGMWSKMTNFEIDTRSPLIVRVPGMAAAGRSTAALVEFVDLYPTLCDLAGLDRPAGLEGYSFAPLLDNPELPWKSAAFSQYPRSREIMGYSMRTDRYRYTEWRRHDGSVVGVELYDHQVDPQENTNVANDPTNAALREQLARQLAAGWQAAMPPSP